MRKKIRQYIWSIIAILAMTSTALAQVDFLSIEGTTTAQNGQNVDIFVNATNAINIGSLQLDILFNKDVLFANDATIGDIAIGSTFTQNIDNNNGIITIGLINLDGFSGTGSIAKINFTVNGVEGDISPLDIILTEITDPDGVSTTVGNIVNSTFTVTGPAQVPGVDLTVDAIEKQTEVNVNATYFINVSNTGNVIDTFDLTIQNPQNAVATLNMILGQTSITLSPGTFATGLLNVTNTGPGIFAVNLTATSQNDAAINKTINTTTTVVEPTVPGVDLIVDNPEKQTNVDVNATYILTLTNTGNIPDIFDLTVQNPQNAIASLDLATATLEAGQSRDFNLNVTSTTPGNFIVNVTATSQTDNAINDTISTNTTVLEIVPVLTNITVTPILAPLVVGDNQIFTATAKDQNGAVMAGINITWASDNITVGNVTPKNAITDVNGIATTTFTANGTGIATINAANGTVTGSATATVTSSADIILPIINSVLLDNQTPIVGTNILVTVNATDNIGVISVTANGSILVNQGGDIWNGTIVASPGLNSVNVSATDAGGNVAFNNSTTYTGVAAPIVPVLTNITVTPINAQLIVGGTQIFTAAAKDQNGAVMAGINITWTSDNIAVGNVTPKNAITDVNGIATTTFTANGTGIATINAANGTVTGSATASVSLPSPVNITIRFGAGNGVGNRGKMINTSVNITNSAATQTFVIDVSGVTSDGFPLVGTGTVIVPAGQTINNVPIILVVPPTATLGTYSLFAAVWTIETFPTSPELTSSGHIIATVN